MHNHTTSKPAPPFPKGGAAAKRLRGFFLLVLALLTALPAHAQDLTHSAPAQQHTVVISGATVHTAAGEVIENGLVAFNDGSITMVGRADDILPRASFTRDTRMIDATGLHLFPGLIAAETQLGLTEVNAVRATRDMDETGSVTPEVRAYVAVNPDTTLIPVARSNGVLTFGVFPTGGLVPGRASVLRADGWTTEDLAIRRDAGLVINFPSVTEGYRAFPGEHDHAPDSLRERLRPLNDLFDAAEAYASEKSAFPDRATDIRLAALSTVLASAGDEQRHVYISANDADRITAAVTWAVSRSLRPVIVGGRDAPLVAGLLTTHDVPVIISGTHTWPKRTDSPHDDPFTLPKRLADAGVRFCINTADRDGNVRNLPYEAGRAVAFGLTPEQALHAVTRSAAEILGIDDLGTIEPGKRATLILTTDHCLEVVSTVEHAFIDGREIDLSNKQTKLRDKYRDKYHQLDIIDAPND